jgi:hypothetical protein
MDTFKDKQLLDDLYEGGHPPWEVWRERDGVSGNELRPGGNKLYEEPLAALESVL